MTELSLVASTVRYFERLGYGVERDVVLFGESGTPQSFDLLLRKGDDVRLVYVKDWVRSVGVNMVIKIDRAAEDVGVRRPILVARVFSDHAYAYSNRHGVTLLTPKELSKADSPANL
jgi:hypothetical protein